MKRILKVAAIVLVLFALGVGGLLAVTFMGRRPMTDGEDVSGIRVLESGYSRVAVIPIGRGQVALVDAGQDSAGASIKSELARRQLSPDAVTAILLTHGHPDHVAAIGAFPKAQVMALDAEVALVEGRVRAGGPLPRLFPMSGTGVKVSRPLQDGDVVTLGDVQIRVYAVPGHTAGSAAYLANGVLMIGDSADVTVDGALQGSPWLFSDSQTENRATLVSLERRLVADGVTVAAIVPSHSGTARSVGPLTDFARREESSR